LRELWVGAGDDELKRRSMHQNKLSRSAEPTTEPGQQPSERHFHAPRSDSARSPTHAVIYDELHERRVRV